VVLGTSLQDAQEEAEGVVAGAAIAAEKGQSPKERLGTVQLAVVVDAKDGGERRGVGQGQSVFFFFCRRGAVGNSFLVTSILLGSGSGSSWKRCNVDGLALAPKRQHHEPRGTLLILAHPSVHVAHLGRQLLQKGLRDADGWMGGGASQLPHRFYLSPSL